ncbi:MAG: hypothetical protein KIT35_21970 [Piscinibacter sp.]|uniref:hypothetical protein n=1 Tax=Piscinibacter sp. TaxID=1903157 RepID=UPI00258383D6|nr:hypothetical protein [Piscinibacter sp.]MCW5666508.1 hypothetical protein [Piscinibacter sp.]
MRNRTPSLSPINQRYLYVAPSPATARALDLLDESDKVARSALFAVECAGGSQDARDHLRDALESLRLAKFAL